MGKGRAAIDLVGRKFGKLTVSSRAENLYQQAAWECTCECGNTTVVAGHSLRSGNTKSCGCLRHLSKGSPAKDITGMQFGRWIVTSRAENRGTGAYWNCTCACGNTAVVSGTGLRLGHSKSCGCYQRDIRATIRGPKHPGWKGKRLIREQRVAQMDDKCAICGSTKKLCWDHDHSTGKYRGTLCNNCNRAIGLMRDNIDTLENAIQYLKGTRS